MDAKKKVTLLVAAVATVFTVIGLVLWFKINGDVSNVFATILLFIGVIAGLVANLVSGAIITSFKLIIFIIKKVVHIVLNFPIAMSCLLWLFALICVLGLIIFGVLYAIVGIAVLPIVPALIRLIAEKLYIE